MTHAMLTSNAPQTALVSPLWLELLAAMALAG
jgi:hypothetical protein